MNQKRADAIRKAWKKSKAYIGPDKKTSLYTTWRARVFTKKGKKAGFPDKWKSFKGFKEEMLGGWEEGKILVRNDTKLPFSIDNCSWVAKTESQSYKSVKFEYNGSYKTLIEWCVEYDLSYNGVRQRYYKGQNYTAEQILFGKRIAVNTKKIKDWSNLDAQAKRTKISKMLSAYKLKDKKKGREFNLTKKFFEKNIISQPCVYCGAKENVGCDRINNKIGHIIGNVVPACYTCNTVRNNHFTFEEMGLMGKTIKKIMSRRIEIAPY